jgi:solute carrier family 15 oligopeptide transporter 1
MNEFCLYFFTFIGAIISDSWLGIYKTLVTMSILCTIGVMIVSIAAVQFTFIPIRIFSFIGLTAAMIAMGCIKSNQNVFGGNQFKLPEQSNLLYHYFSLHYLVLKTGQFLGMMMMPILREDVKCFGENDCYSLAFGIPAILMAMAVYVLWLGRKKYIHIPPNGNVLIKVLSCVKYSIKMKMLSSSSQRKAHFLDYAEDKFDLKLVKDTKIVLSVLKMYLPLPIFWALLNQQSSRWVFQATRMNGNIGFYTIKPDQMIVLGPCLIMVLIPIFNQVLFPLLERMGIKSTLQKMSCGMICAGLSFLVSAYVETRITNYEVSILWLIPQYVIVAISEILLWVANISFAYTQAPQSMKSVMTATAYITVAGGSLIVFLISGLQIFSSQVYEFIFYACLMFIDTLFFALLSMRYKYIDLDASSVANHDTNHA